MEVSVIIPHYNNQDVIERSINSVLKQTYQDFEIIIVDDFSRDVEKLEAIISKINDDRIKLVKHTQNKNGSSARNTGVENAKGEHIAFLDADDEWTEIHLEKSFNKANELTELFLIYSKSEIKTSKEDGLIMPEIEKGKQSISDYLFCKDGFIQSSSFFLKTELAKKIKWNERLVRHQDYDYLIQLENHGIEFVFSNSVDVIVHWENNNTIGKGESWKYSLGWAKQQKFTKKQYDNFISQFVLYKILRENKILAFKIFIKEKVNPFNLTKRKIYNLFNLLLN